MHYYSIFLAFIFTYLCLPVHAQDILVERKALGRVTHPVLSELSGLVPSVRYDSCYWVHNDSGDAARIYLIDNKAALRCTVELEGVDAIDMEDVAWLYKDGRYHLLIGDIGDNRAVRTEIGFYLIEEPIWDGNGKHIVVPHDQITHYKVQYPDKPRDAEAFFVDPISGELILISKRDFHVHVYSSDMLGKATSATHILQKQVQLPIMFVTAADIATNGQQILIKNLGHIFQWNRFPEESVVDALKRPYKEVSYRSEPQGEAIAFDRDGKSFYTISERPLGLDSYLYNYQYTN